MIKMSSKAQLNREVTRIIKSSDKPPRSWKPIKVAQRTIKDLKKKKLGVSWGIIALIAIPVLIVVFLLIIRKKGDLGGGGRTPGEFPDGKDLGDMDIEEQLRYFGYKG